MVRGQFRDVRGRQDPSPRRSRHAPPPRLLQETDALTGLAAADRDRWLGVLWAPAGTRPALTAAHLLDLELAHVAIDAREPMLGAIKLAWWSERLTDLAEGRPAPPQPLLQALQANAANLPLAAMANWQDAWLPLLEDPKPDWAAHARLRGEALFTALAAALGEPLPPNGAQAGAAWAAGQVARGGLGVAAEGAVLDALTPLAAPAALPRSLRPLLALARLGARDLARARSALPAEPSGALPRQWLLASTSLIG